MTAEIIIVNRQGIALAADSAVTTGRNRVWKSANKLFSLSPCNDIGIMIYNSGDFAGFPWEVVIKEFRKVVRDQVFRDVGECEAAFFDFLIDDRFITSSQGSAHVLLILVHLLSDFSKRNKYRSRGEMEKTLFAYIAHRRTHLQDLKSLNSLISKRDFDNLFLPSVKAVAKDELSFQLRNATAIILCDFLFEIVTVEYESAFMTGIVFAGFGSEQLLPYVAHYIVDGRVDYTPAKNNQKVFLRYWQKGISDFNSDENVPAVVIPYAQYDMFYLFMEGILPRSLGYIARTIDKVLEDKSIDLIKTYVPVGQQEVETQLQSQQNAVISDEFLDQFRKFRQTEYVNTILEIVQTLPREEMAAMAEALVELTSLRRRVGSPLESVGGPTDVALISKGDGFIWIKRKHYFNIDLNRDFMIRRKSGRGGGDDE